MQRVKTLSVNVGSEAEYVNCVTSVAAATNDVATKPVIFNTDTRCRLKSCCVNLKASQTSMFGCIHRNENLI